MPVADSPRADPSKSVINDPVKQTPVPPAGQPTVGAPQPSSNAKPPAFVRFGTQKVNGPAPAVTVTPDPLASPTAPVRNMSTDGGPVVLGVQTPPVTVEKRAMAQPRPGEPQVFQLIVRNHGPTAAAQVGVEDELPADAKVLQAEPAPVIQGNRAVWMLNDLAPGGVRVCNLMLHSATVVDMHTTRIHVMAANSNSAAATPPSPTPQAQTTQAPTAALGVQVAAPAGVPAGQPVVFEVTYGNIGKQRVTGMVLHAVLSDGLRHPVGQSIEANVGDLEPGMNKTVKITATAVQPGRQGMQVHVKCAAGAEASAQTGLDVLATSTGLTVQQAPAVRMFVGRMADLRIEVTNNSARPMRNVCIASFLPEGLEFVAASDYGNHQPNNRTVNWRLDPLAPGQTQAVFVRVQPAAQGVLQHGVIARADGVPECRSAAALTVEGIADLAISLQGDTALEVGKETTYEIRVGNPGSGPNTHVRVELAFTPGLVPRSARVRRRTASTARM